MIYTSRYANPTLRNGDFTCVRISLGTPKWSLGYQLTEFKELMPFGLLNKYEDYAPFREEYFRKLDKIGVDRIYAKLNEFEKLGKDVVLLCYEDIRKGPEDWCHRTAFAEWWLLRTGERIGELYDPTTPKVKAAPKPPKTESKPLFEEDNNYIQLSLF